MATSEFNTIVGNVKTIASGVTSGISKVKSIISDPGKNASAIRDKYLSGFLGDTTQFTPSVFPRLFDEPTYLTFHIEFNTTGTDAQNRNLFSVEPIADTGSTYDYLPEPLLLASDVGENKPTTSKFENTYSTEGYLRSVLGETKRADLLHQLIDEINDIQTNYPYYFTSISGLDRLAKVNASKGIRIPEGTSISIKCYEGLDLKITQLMQLYRKIAWDDVYQRWMLPDMMRFFNVKIYVSEIRLFHSSSVSAKRATHGKLYDFMDNYNSTIIDKNQMGATGSILNTAGTILSNVSAVSERLMGSNNKFNEVLGSVSNTYEAATGIYSDVITTFSRMCNNAINDVMPTICFDCHMCEFDLENTLHHISSLNSANRKDSPSPEIVIKVGQVEEVQMYPLNGKLGINDAKDLYVMNIKRDKSPASYISDDDLARDNTILQDRHYANSSGEVLDAYKLSLPGYRINKKMIDMEKDSYSKDGSSREAAIRSLAIGAANVVDQYGNVFQGGRSAATSNSDAARQSADIVDYREKVPASMATQTKTRSGSIIDNPKPGTATDNPERTGRGERESHSEATSPYESPKIIEDSSISSVATETNKQIEKLINDYDAITISAATRVLQGARQSVLDSSVVASLYLSDEERTKLANEMYKNILIDIVQSPATAGGLRDTASLILDYSANREMPSTAVDKAKEESAIIDMSDIPTSLASSDAYNGQVDRGKVYSDYDKVEISHAVKHNDGNISSFSLLNIPYVSTATADANAEQIIDIEEYASSEATREGQDRESAYEGDYTDIEMSHATHPSHNISEARTEMPRDAESTATEKYNAEHIGTDEYEISHATHSKGISSQYNEMPRDLSSEAVDKDITQESMMPEGVEMSHATHAKRHISDQYNEMPRDLRSEAVDKTTRIDSVIDVEMPEAGTATNIYYNKTAAREKIMNYRNVELSHATKSHKKFE